MVRWQWIMVCWLYRLTLSVTCLRIIQLMPSNWSSHEMSRSSSILTAVPVNQCHSLTTLVCCNCFRQLYHSFFYSRLLWLLRVDIFIFNNLSFTSFSPGACLTAHWSNRPIRPVSCWTCRETPSVSWYREDSPILNL